MRRTREEILRVTNSLFNALENEGVLEPFEFRCKGACIIYNPEAHLNDLERVKLNKVMRYKRSPIIRANNDKICGHLIPLFLAHQ